MRPWLSFVVFAFSIGAAMAEDLPPAVQKAIAENKMEIVVTDGRHIGQVRKTCHCIGRIERSISALHVTRADDNTASGACHADGNAVTRTCPGTGPSWTGFPRPDRPWPRLRGGHSRARCRGRRRRIPS